MKYGKDLDWRIEGDDTNERGERTVQIAIPWTPGLKIANGTITMAEVPSPPTMSGMKFGGRSLRRTNDGGMSIILTYKGVDPDAGGLNTEGEIGTTYRISGSLYQRYIKTHPDFPKLKTIYLWDEEKKEFSDTVPFVTPDMYGWGGANNNTTDIPNPFAGVTSFDDSAMMIFKTYLVRELKLDPWMRRNKIVKTAIPGLGQFEDRDFKYGTADADPFGRGYRITEKLELSGPGGWLKPLYEKI